MGLFFAPFLLGRSQFLVHRRAGENEFWVEGNRSIIGSDTVEYRTILLKDFDKMLKRLEWHYFLLFREERRRISTVHKYAVLARAPNAQTSHFFASVLDVYFRMVK